MRFSRSMTAVFVCVALAGCANRSSGPLIADAWSPIKDVPVPAGFTLSGDSRADVANNQRTVDHRYTGSDDIGPVLLFYKEQLPKYGWKLDNTEQVSAKETILHFSKEKGKPENCIITITARPWTFDTAIKILISPAAAPATTTKS